MKVRFIYTDHTEWEGTPEEAHLSPDPRPPEGGIIRMTVIHDEMHVPGGRKLHFLYDDLYYMFRIAGGWRFGSGTPSRQYDFFDADDQGSTEVPMKIPTGSLVRYGCTVSDEEAVKFGIIPVGSDYKLHPKRIIPIELVPYNAARVIPRG